MGVETECVARLQGVHKRYGAVQALEGFDLAVPPGQLLALLGPNGAGKSTAIHLLLGLSSPDQGRAELLGQDPRELAARRGLGVMLQSAGIAETLRVEELLTLTRSYYPQPRSIADCVAMAGLQGLLGRRYGQLSGGQQRRVQFALAICGNPRVLFLDEPTAGLDIEARQILWATVRELVAGGCAVLLTTHYLEEAEALADRVCVIQNGRRVAEGSVAEIRAHVSQRRVRCVSRLSPDTIAQWPQVRQARREGERLEIVAEHAEDLVRRLLAEDATLAELEVTRAGLAEAFLALTQETPTTEKEAA